MVATSVAAPGREPKATVIEHAHDAHNRRDGGHANVNEKKRISKEIDAAFAKPWTDDTKAKPLPGDFPAFDRKGFLGGNMSGMESRFTQLWISNSEQIEVLKQYTASSVRSTFEQRLSDEKKSHALRLLYAAIAAEHGSKLGATTIYHATRATGYPKVLSTQSAIGYLLARDDRPAPKWVVRLAIASLRDDRSVTGLQKTNWASDTEFRVSYLAAEFEDLAHHLANAKAKDATPALIALAQKSDGDRSYVMALGTMGDQRAAATLLKLLKKHLPDASWREGYGMSEKASRLTHAIGSLKVRDAVPVLMEHATFPACIEALESIGDERALPLVKRIVASKGVVKADGKTHVPALDKPRWVAARYALAAFSKDPHSAYWALLKDKSLDQYQRRTAVWRLGNRPDPRNVPHLIQAIQSDASGTVVNQSITVLRAHPYRQTIEGLIACFDADFNGKTDWKRAYTPQMFRKNIADTLQHITGQTLPPTRESWAKWWKVNRDNPRWNAAKKKEKAGRKDGVKK